MKDKIIKVLVVDDSAYNRMKITDMLESSPMVKVVGVALDGEDAIKKAINLKPDIITLDLEMPRMDGFTFLRIMASNFPTPTIVVSSRNDSQNVFKALEFGAVDFIEKPTHQASSELLKISVRTGEVVGEQWDGGDLDLGASAWSPVPTPPAKLV